MANTAPLHLLSAVGSVEGVLYVMVILCMSSEFPWGTAFLAVFYGTFLVLSSAWRKVDHLSLLQTCLNRGVVGLCCSKETATVKLFRIGVI